MTEHETTDWISKLSLPFSRTFELHVDEDDKPYVVFHAPVLGFPATLPVTFEADEMRELVSWAHNAGVVAKENA